MTSNGRIASIGTRSPSRDIGKSTLARPPPKMAKPFALIADPPREHGVLLVHGFLASPAELRSLGERFVDAGFGVIGVRLKGHGTSPWDLRERSYEDWLESVRRGFRSAQGLFERVSVVGFSTGGALALLLAAERPEQLHGVVSVAAPMRFQNPNMRFVPIVHGVNRLVRWLSSSEGVMPFRPNPSEHPDVNYFHMPVRGLFELTRMVAELERRLGEIRCPVALMQGSRDPVVVPDSVHLIADGLTGTSRTVRMLDSDRHGILYQDIDGAQSLTVDLVRGFGRTGGDHDSEQGVTSLLR